MSTVDRSALSPLRLGLVAVAAAALFLGVAAGSALSPLTDVIEVVVDQFGYDYVLAAALGIVAVAAGLGTFASGRASTMRQAEMPIVERPVPVPSAGDPFDETIGSLRFASRLLDGERREAVRERLRAAAVAAVVVDEGCSREAARRQVDDGRWTDDPDAAAFLAGQNSSLETWLTALRHAETAPEYRARRTVAAIVDRREPGDASGDGSVPPSGQRPATEGTDE